jgi:non-ribosomal peptide synthetase component F
VFRRRGTFILFTVLATGLVVQTGRRSVVGMLAGAGMASEVSFHAACRFFSSAVWDIGADGMIAHIDYYADVYDEASVARFANGYRAVLRGASSSAEVPVTELPVMLAGAYEDIAAQASGTAIAYDKECCAHELVLGQARDDPGRVALIEGDRAITYGEVYARSAAVAAELLKRVTVPAAHVAICLPRSAEMTVAIVGVLRAGFSYIPLDPEYPAARLAFIREDADVAAMVTRGDLGDVIPGRRADGLRGRVPAMPG